MAQQEAEILRGYELRLIRCTISPSPSDAQTHSQPSDSHHSRIHEDILRFIEAGDYLGALSSEAARLVLGPAHFGERIDSVECAERVYSELLERIESFLSIGSKEDDVDKAFRLILVLCVGIAAYLWFIQCNLTGPLEGLQKCPLPFNVSESKELVEWETWARKQLMSVGSDLIGKLSNLQYLVFSKMLLMRVKDVLFEASFSPGYGIMSISWWLVRVLLIQQRILDERSSLLFDMLKVYTAEALHQFGTLEKVKSYWSAKLQDEEASSIVSTIHLEAGVLEYIYGRVDSAKLHFESAETTAGIQLSLTGILGFRTVHQVDAKPQMVLITNSNSSNGGIMHSSEKSDVSTPETVGDGTSDIFMTPKILDNGYEAAGANEVCLKPVQQALILAQCLLIEKSGRQDELQRWDMAPYIEAIDSQESTCFILRCFCDLLRIRWESSRSRTKERALGMMDRLVESISKAAPGVSQRILFCSAVHLPTLPALRKEYGELLVSCGLVGEAITIFESLELWDNLIYCYSLLGKKAAAVDLIKVRLSEMPNDARLWCSLGDVTDNDACYEKALEVSDNKSARAKRSLARSAYNRGDYEKSKNLWESAMALNSLYPDGWFAFGAAALKARDVEKAIDAFTRAVQLDPDNGEAWNNIACLHMIKKKSKESFIAFKEALKYKRDSWQMWENFSHVAMDVGNIAQAVEAIQKILNMSKNKRIDAALLDRIMQELERRKSASKQSPASAEDGQASTDQSAENDSSLAASRETDHLLELLGKVLQQIVRNESNAAIWGLYARWHKMKGDLMVCCEALLKQVRAYQGSELWKDREQFKKFASASLELCKVYMQISSTTGSRRELFSAEMHLKSIIKQAATSFPDAEEFRDLESCLDEVRITLQN